jgi:Ca-activated chloride channel family protein
MLLLAVASMTARADTWSDLWATREQQAQKLLDSKRPAEAAPLFADPRRRGYAELRAGQYAKAAEHLAPFKDAESQYNRGNALAHTGKLQDALAAYDAALKQSPGSRDVRHNRDLVAQALKQQQNQGQGQPNGGQSSGGSNGQGGQKQENPSQADNKPPSNRDGQSGDHSQQGGEGSQGQQGNPSQAGSPKQPDSPGQSGNQPSKGNQPQAGNPAQADSQAQANNRAQQASPSAGTGNASADDPSKAAARSQPPQANSAGAAQAQPQGSTQTPTQAQAPTQGQAEREPVNTPAQAPTQSQSLAEAGQRGGSRADALSAKKALAGADAPPQQPRSEQALAMDQWLRGIPEDSGELLRRKFMIEHMMKQQGNEP